MEDEALKHDDKWAINIIHNEFGHYRNIIPQYIKIELINCGKVCIMCGRKIYALIKVMGA